MGKPTFESIPENVLVDIARFCSPADINRLLLVNKKTNRALTPLLKDYDFARAVIDQRDSNIIDMNAKRRQSFRSKNRLIMLLQTELRNAQDGIRRLEDQLSIHGTLEQPIEIETDLESGVETEEADSEEEDIGEWHPWLEPLQDLLQVIEEQREEAEADLTLPDGLTLQDLLWSSDDEPEEGQLTLGMGVQF